MKRILSFRFSIFNIALPIIFINLSFHHYPSYAEANPSTTTPINEPGMAQKRISQPPTTNNNNNNNNSSEEFSSQNLQNPKVENSGENPTQAFMYMDPDENILFKDKSLFEKAILRGDLHAVRNISSEYPHLLNPPVPEAGTPIYYGVVTNNPEVTELLIQKGAKVDTNLKDGLTALALACHLNLPNVAEVLLRYGANMDVIIGGISLIDKARVNNQFEIVALLLSYQEKRSKEQIKPAPKDMTNSTQKK